MSSTSVLIDFKAERLASILSEQISISYFNVLRGGKSARGQKQEVSQLRSSFQANTTIAACDSKRKRKEQGKSYRREKNDLGCKGYRTPKELAEPMHTWQFLLPASRAHLQVSLPALHYSREYSRAVTSKAATTNTGKERLTVRRAVHLGSCRPSSMSL